MVYSTLSIGLAALACLGSLQVARTANTSSSAPLLRSGYLDLEDYAEAYAKATAFLEQLSYLEKIQIITGQSVSGNVTWTALENTDGVNGVDNAYFASMFTSPSALGMTWNRTLFYAQYKAEGEEFYDKGYNLVNGPVQGPLGRVPWSGRYPEAVSPEPYLSGIVEGLATAGFNDAGVVTVGRHFLLNEQETNRFGGGYSSNADDKTIHELYLWPFADSVRAGMMACMCAMNRVNGSLSCESSSLLNGLLKTDIGFPGMVLPDVGGQSTAFGSANGGLDYGSSSIWSESILSAGIKNGSFTEERLDDMVVRQLLGYFAAGLDDGKQPAQSSGAYRDVRGNHSSVIKQTAREALVLLKNERSGIRGLPLSNPRSIGLFGAHAGPVIGGPNQPQTVSGSPAEVYPGHLAGPSGSGVGSYPYIVDPYASISARAVADDSMLLWIMNDTYTSPWSLTNSGGGVGGSGMPSTSGNTTVLASRQANQQGTATDYTLATVSYSGYASFAEVCLVFVNAWSGEGADRSSLNDVAQDAMVTEVANNCNNTIVIVNVAGPRTLDAWIDHENVTAVLYSGLLGQDSGNAIADVLYGDVNPSGKLTYTIVNNGSDYPAAVCGSDECDYTEGVFIDYRYFDAHNISVRYPFGHGLSYTSFTYGDLEASVTNSSALKSTFPTEALTLGGQRDLYEEVITATINITNSGDLEGAEVVQLYISFPEEAEQPPRILRGFEKILLTSSEGSSVKFSLRRRDISYWNTTAQGWAIAKGEYTFAVGASSRDIRSTTVLSVI